MSQENVEVVRRTLDAFLSGDVETALSFYDPDVEWDGTNLPDGQIGRGHEAIMEHLRRWAAQWDEWTVEVERIVDARSDRVVVFLRERGRSASGLNMDELHAELYDVRGGMIVRRQGFSDPSDALEAVGLGVARRHGRARVDDGRHRGHLRGGRRVDGDLHGRARLAHDREARAPGP